MKTLACLPSVLILLGFTASPVAAEFKFRHHYLDRELPGASWAQPALADVDKDGRLDG